MNAHDRVIEEERRECRRRWVGRRWKLRAAKLALKTAEEYGHENSRQRRREEIEDLREYMREEAGASARLRRAARASRTAKNGSGPAPGSAHWVGIRDGLPPLNTRVLLWMEVHYGSPTAFVGQLTPHGWLIDGWSYSPSAAQMVAFWCEWRLVDAPNSPITKPGSHNTP